MKTIDGYNMYRTQCTTFVYYAVLVSFLNKNSLKLRTEAEQEQDPETGKIWPYHCFNGVEIFCLFFILFLYENSFHKIYVKLRKRRIRNTYTRRL